LLLTSLGFASLRGGRLASASLLLTSLGFASLRGGRLASASLLGQSAATTQSLPECLAS
jgi:hypothetical protein